MMATTILFIRFSNGIRLCELEVIQRDKLITFGHIRAGMERFSSSSWSLCGAVKSYFQALLGQLPMLIAFPKEAL